jgi:hypothetical protein
MRPEAWRARRLSFIAISVGEPKSASAIVDGGRRGRPARRRIGIALQETDPRTAGT